MKNCNPQKGVEQCSIDNSRYEKTGVVLMSVDRVIPNYHELGRSFLLHVQWQEADEHGSVAVFEKVENSFVARIYDDLLILWMKS